MLLLGADQIATAADNWIRNTSDGEVVRKRFCSHPCLLRAKNIERHFSIQCENQEVTTWLRWASSYAPWPPSPNRLRVTAHCEFHPLQWVGYQSKNSIHLYYPAYENVFTLIFSFFHEFGHILQEHSIIPGSGVIRAREKVANGFAWFCCNWDFLKITDRELSQVFAGIFPKKQFD